MDPPSPLPRGWTSTSCRPLPTEPNSPPLATAARTTADPGCTTSLSTTNTTSWSQNFAVALEPSQTHTNKHLATAIEALSCNKDHPMTSPSLETSPEFPQPWTPPAPPADRGQFDPEELYSRPEIEQLQFDLLRWTLHHAYNNVPAYQELYDNHGVHPSDFKKLADLELFPTIDKQFLRAAYPFKALAVPMDQVRRIHASSGTTGQPTTVAYTENDIEMWASLVARSMRASGVQPG